MGIFKKPEETNYQPAVSTATSEKKDTAAKKARLLETQGGNKGAEINNNQGQSIRKIFG